MYREIIYIYSKWSHGMMNNGSTTLLYVRKIMKMLEVNEYFIYTLQFGIHFNI